MILLNYALINSSFAVMHVKGFPKHKVGNFIQTEIHFLKNISIINAFYFEKEIGMFILVIYSKSCLIIIYTNLKTKFVFFVSKYEQKPCGKMCYD